MPSEKCVALLRKLAQMYGVQVVYRDSMGRHRKAEPDALLAVLRALGAPVEQMDDIGPAFRECRERRWRRLCEPVMVAWETQNGEQVQVKLALPADLAEERVDCHLELENGQEECWICELSGLPLLQVETVENVKYAVRLLSLPPGLPRGYHRLSLVLPASPGHGRRRIRGVTRIITAPHRAYVLPPEAGERMWGVFVPLYALHSRESWGIGDFSDLAALSRWVHALGGSIVGTVPFLAAFLDQPFEPSPYAPVSRLFWNELYLDASRVPELEHCPEASSILNSSRFQEESAFVEDGNLVDYGRAMALKRRVLEHLARHCFSEDCGRRSGLFDWISNNPVVRDYARFRATIELRGCSWPEWPARMRDGELREGDYDREAERYHTYVQWLANEQLNAVARADHPGTGLYLDMPLGVHPLGYDVWRYRDAFVSGVDCGAPPDYFFPRGQNWGFPPLHPERIREQDYDYFISCLRHHLNFAKVLRLDHVMGLHRVYCIPRGFPATEGVYVRYRAEEFYAILALESHRRQALIIGEDLGTVPRYVRREMTRHGIHRMYVLQLELNPHAPRVLRPIARNTLACLNTHDMPPFTHFWLTRDHEERASLIEFLRREGSLDPDPKDLGTSREDGLLDCGRWDGLVGAGRGNAGHVLIQPAPIESVLRAALAFLAISNARILLINLEDLWLETEPHNVPGTNGKRPNWRRKARYSLEEFTRMPELLEILKKVDRLRKADRSRKVEPEGRDVRCRTTYASTAISTSRRGKTPG